MTWIPFDKRLSEYEYFTTIGKALFVCQHFENSCKNLCMWLSLSKAVNEDTLKLLSKKSNDYVDKLLGLYLGNAILRMESKLTEMFSDDEISILKLAKNSRNYICHDSQLSLISAPFGPAYDWNCNETEIKQHVVNIVEGDFLISKCSYEFHEKLPATFKDKGSYVNTLVNWALGKIANKSLNPTA